MESSRTVVDSALRGTDVFLKLIQFAGTRVVASGKRFMVFSSHEKLARTYRSMGARVIGTFTLDPDPRVWFLQVLDVPGVLCGKGINPVVWNMMMREPYVFLTGCGRLVPDTATTLRVTFHRAAYPLLAWAMRGSQYLKRTKKDPRTPKIDEPARPRREGETLP